MSIKDTDKFLLLLLAGVAFVIFTFFYVSKPHYEDAKRIESECKKLQERLAYLQEKEAHREEYIAGIETYKEKFDAVLAAFAPDLNQEVSIMFLQGIRNDYEYDINNVGLGEKKHFYTLGNGAGAEAVLDSSASSDGLTDASAPVQSNPYECYRADFPINYVGSYQSLKDVVNYVDNFAQRMTIDSVNIAYNEDNDEYTGSMNLVCYSIEGEDRPETSLELNEVEIGVDNIFLGGNAAQSVGAEKLTKYDSNEGAEIVNNYDFYAMLNPASSDVSAKVLGQNGTGKEATVISGSDNSVSVVNFDFYEQDGKNYCKYTLDNSTSYEAEITSAEDVKILLQSSARKDADDKVGVRVTIRNTTTLPVYFKINGDDAASPRVNITSKTGAVKVY